MDSSIRRACAAILVGLGILALWLAFLAVVRGQYLAGHPRNPRAAMVRREIVRGGILLAGGEVVARDAGAGGPRLYAGPQSLSHLVGYEDPRYGTAGLESAYNAVLLGLDRGPSLAARLGRLLGRGPERGSDLILTIDLEIQRAVERAMAGRRGAVVVLEPRTGAVLAMLSNPGFSQRQVSSEWERLASASSGPLFNRATLGLYPPGSTIKPIVACIALSAGALGPGHVTRCAGSISVGEAKGDSRTISCPSGARHGELDLAGALVASCNVAFAQIGWQIGAGRLYNGLREFGFAESLPFEVTAIAGRLPDAATLDRASVAQLAIGQGELVTSPLHMAVMVAALADGGVMRRPYVVSEVRSPDGRTIQRTRPAIRQVPVSATVARQVTRMMVEAVARGTGLEARVPGVEVAGKTGTAENPGGAPHAWFVGFAPANKPAVALAVVVENGGSGGKVAAPIAREIVRASLARSVAQGSLLR